MTRGKRYGVTRGVPGRDLCDESGWPLRNDQILEKFGLKPNGPIPPTFHGEKRIGDTMVFIVSQDVARQSKVKRRTIAQCNHCERLICAGHLNQHIRGTHLR